MTSVLMYQRYNHNTTGASENSLDDDSNGVIRLWTGRTVTGHLPPPARNTFPFPRKTTIANICPQVSVMICSYRVSDCGDGSVIRVSARIARFRVRV